MIKNKKIVFIISFIVLIMIYILFAVNIKLFFIRNKLDIFISNYFYILDLINKFKWLIIAIIFFIVFIYFRNKFIFKFEKISIFGIDILVKNPEKILKQSIVNYLNTKRTLFKINIEQDNFYETINSYYNIYVFLREKLLEYDLCESSSYVYENVNSMIEILNKFLTKHQNNYKRWYENIICKDDMFNLDIYDIQREYRHYEELIDGFKEVNTDFCEIAKKMNINTSKWS